MKINNYTRRILVSYIFLGWFSYTLFYVSGIEILLWFWTTLLLYSVALFLIYAGWKFIYWREQSHFFLFFIVFLYRISVLITILVILVGWFALYHNELRPAYFPLYTLSNWEKTLKFQTVSHIASPSFYFAIRNSILDAKNDDYVLFFEWVRPGSEENSQAFNEALGINFSDTLYENFSRLYGVVAQDNLIFLWLGDTPDINVDLDIDTIMELYRAKQVWIERDTSLSEVLEVDDEIILLLSKLGERELLVLQYINQAMLNFFMKNDWLQWQILERSGIDIFAVILWERDRYIANFIHENDFDKIFALYGKLHFEWILKELRLRDMRWQITDVRYKQVIERSSEVTEESYTQLQNTNQKIQERLLQHIQMSD